ncbi:uncharacterized protein BO96DRAFT_488180 [Aspergillus niger CBS 101883]|uniref:Uncharacterized protein n=2 Tax=Aspergillus niger TaxID=5061 RepID=A2QUF4_ASPNC|nr:uncharacterized protein BO96DRAFT_488180 [Aspergillus niger CBS 101883]XP_059606951.1 hypothetical protein An09g05470 [Aspergillus niger]PYH51317.1 hypothetical protein BO96DRAFT_488180 [Aspergillus niger CBS 101883]CAL00823.1 hypothetical protein An09g05470 [Aspergillus niger]
MAQARMWHGGVRILPMQNGRASKEPHEIKCPGGENFQGRTGQACDVPMLTCTAELKGRKNILMSLGFGLVWTVDRQKCTGDITLGSCVHTTHNKKHSMPKPLALESIIGKHQKPLNNKGCCVPHGRYYWVMATPPLASSQTPADWNHCSPDPPLLFQFSFSTYEVLTSPPPLSFPPYPTTSPKD